jgi:hypothetical protein
MALSSFQYPLQYVESLVLHLLFRIMELCTPSIPKYFAERLYLTNKYVNVST